MHIVEDAELRDRLGVFADREDAGTHLAGIMGDYRGRDALVLAVPAGGVPVAAVVAERLDLPLDVAVVSKISLPWDTEAGYGAVAFDGSVRLNDALVAASGLSQLTVEAGIAETRGRVARRQQLYRGSAAGPEIDGRAVVLVDDGLASGYTLEVALSAVRKAGARTVTIAVPTGHAQGVMRLGHEVEGMYCANVRGGRHFAVADAYRHWRDMDEQEVKAILEQRRNVKSAGIS